MPPPHKGKTPTKGSKQIMAENTATVLFYRNMSLGAGAFYNIFFFIFFYEHMSTFIMVMNILIMVIYITCYQLMRFISRPRYSSETFQLIDHGLDLNMEGGMGEHIKDVVILSSITHLLALVSNYFWLVLLVIPVRAFWLLWTNLLGPWFFQEAPEDTEQDEKKRKKMERKMKRFQ
ncbi:transmembrane protein 208 [Battus philenor]|uniref:transmembrane protein 208 n=1 Tax=Battus philenor TaxID=42288 RepID=UPI0035CEA7C4